MGNAQQRLGNEELLNAAQGKLILFFLFFFEEVNIFLEKLAPRTTIVF